MASQPERIATLEEKLRAYEGHKPVGWKLFAAAVIGAVGWLSYTTVLLVETAQRVSHLEGKVGDPLAATIKGLEAPSSNAVLAANLTLLSAQMSIASANHAKPKHENLNRIANTLSSWSRLAGRV
jgi:hypothetical protein